MTPITGLLLLSSFAFSQPSTAPLTWLDCVRIAQEGSPDVASARHSVEASRATYKGSYNGLMPSVSLTNEYVDSTGSNSSWSLGASASMRVLGAADLANVKSASASLRVSEANYRLASANARLNVRDAFAQLVFSQTNLDTQKRIVQLRERGSDLVTLRYDSGRESKGNMLRAKAQLQQARADLAQATRQMRSAQIALDRELGLDQFQMVAATGTLAPASAPSAPSDMQALAAQRPEIAFQEASLLSSEAGLSQAKSTLWPSLTLGYSRTGVGPNEFPTPINNSTFQGLLSYPLFGGGPTATYFAVQSAKANRERAAQDLRAARDQAISDLESSWASFASSVEQVDVQQALLVAARQRNDEADVRYASGLLTYDNWEIIATDRINTERSALNSQLNAALAEAAWQRALGQGLEQP